jgi:transcriptional regulator
MGIGSYKEAERYRMRTNKNLTRTFYLDTRRTLDEEPFSWEQPQDAGIMQQGAVQEFSNGGRVGFAEGSEAKILELYNQGTKSSEIADQLKLRRPYVSNKITKLINEGKIKERIQDVELNEKLKKVTFEINKRNELGILTRHEDVAKKLGIERSVLTRYMLGNIATSSDLKIPKLLTKEEAVEKYVNNVLKEDKAIASLNFQNIAEYLNSDLSNLEGMSRARITPQYVSRIIEDKFPEIHKTVSKNGAFIARNKNIQQIPTNEFLKNINTIKLEKIKESEKIYDSRAELRILKGKLNLGVRDFAISQAQDNYVKQLNENIRQQVKNIGYDEWIKRNPDLMDYASKRFDSKTGKIIQRTPEEMEKYIDKGFFSIDHKNKKVGEKFNIEFPTNKQIVPSGINSGFIVSSQKYLKDNIDKYGKDLNITRSINNIINEGKKFNFTIGMDEVPNYQGSLLAKNFKGIKNIGGVQTPTVFENTLTGFDEQIKQFNLNTSDVPKNIITPTEEAFGETKTKIRGRVGNLEDVLNTTPEEKKAINLLNRVNLGVDPTQMSELAKQVYAKEINTVKNIFNKIPLPVKTVGKIFGLGDVALELIFAAPDLLRGDVEAAKRGATFGLAGKDLLEEELLEQAEDKDKYIKAKKNLQLIPELRNLTEEKKDVEQGLKKGVGEFQPVLTQNLERINNRIKEINDYLSKNEYLEEDETEFLKTVNKLAKIKTQDAERRFGPQFKQAQGPTLEQRNFDAILENTEFAPYIEKKAIEKIRGTYTPIEIPEIQSPDDSMREGFKKGGISRRDLLALLTGAAVAPELIKAVKGTKKAAQTVRAASKINFEKAEGMYSWFPDLVEKIKTKGKPFEEKEIIMEASYKHEPKGYGGLPKGVETVTRHVDGDTEFLLREYPDGRIAVDIHSPRNQEGSSTPVTLYYRPTMELKYYSGSKVEPAEFKVLEKEPRYFANGPDDVDIEMSEMRKVPGKNTIYGDVEAAERFATGKIENRKIIPVKQARREQMEDAPVDFIEETSPYGPDTF